MGSHYLVAESAVRELERVDVRSSAGRIVTTVDLILIRLQTKSSFHSTAAYRNCMFRLYRSRMSERVHSRHKNLRYQIYALPFTHITIILKYTQPRNERSFDYWDSSREIRMCRMR